MQLARKFTPPLAPSAFQALGFPARRSVREAVELNPAGDSQRRLEVPDQGAGIGPAVLPRIFEPFFTMPPFSLFFPLERAPS